MSGFTRTFTVFEEFDGDVVTVKMKRLTNSELLTIGPLVAAHVGSNDPKATEEMIKAMTDLIPQKVVECTGLKDDAGEPLKLEDIINESYFMSFLDKLMGHLFTKSRPVVDAKKSDKPSQEGPQEASSVTAG